MSDLKLKPIGKSSDEELVEWIKQKVYRDNPLYGEDVARWRKAELYDQNDQILQRAFSYSGAGTASQWARVRQDPSDTTAVYLPVYNEGVGHRENESARLGRPEYKPRVRPRGKNPDLKAKEGAQGAERALISRLKDMRWDVQADRAFWAMPGYGGCWLLSYWDQTWMDTVRVPAPSLRCPRHPSVRPPAAQVASPVTLALPSPPGSPGVVPPEGMAELESETSINGEPVEAEHAVMPLPMECSYIARASDHQGEKVCPHCPDHPTLQEFSPTFKEMDEYGLGKDLPKGDWFLKAPAPYGIFVRDCGMDVDPTNVDEWAYVHVETIDWAAARYPDKMRALDGTERIKPESIAGLLAQNPTLGSPVLLKSAQSLGAFRNHVLVMDWHKHPWFEYNEETKRYEKNRGRSITTINNVGVLDAPFQIPSLTKRGTFVDRCNLEFAAWEFMDGGRRGTVGASLWDRYFDAQDGVNERKGQVRAVNQRGAMPIVLEDRDAQISEAPVSNMAIPYKRLQYSTDPESAKPPMQVINNDTINSGVFSEINDDREYMVRSGGASEVEKGTIPPGAGAATSIAYLKTESGEKRRPRIKRFREALVRKWQHGLDLMAAMYIEPRSYQYEDETGEERQAFITGDVIAAANPKVDIYPAPDFDAKDIQRENVRDAINLGVIDPKASSRVNREIVRIFDDSLDLFLDDDLQEEQAEREWQRFKEQGTLPVVDPGIDDDATHIEEHGRNIMSAWFRWHEEACNWDGALEILGNQWDETLQQIGMMAKTQGLAPQPLIKKVWEQKLQGFRSPDPDALYKVLCWRAHYEAHRLRIIMAQVTPQASTAAPGQGSAPQPTNEAQPEQPQPVMQ